MLAAGWVAWNVASLLLPVIRVGQAMEGAPAVPLFDLPSISPGCLF